MEAATSISASTAMEQTPLLGDITAKPPRQKFVLRPAHISDFPIMAVHSKEAYWLSPVARYLFPGAEAHPEDVVRLMIQGIEKRFVAADSLSLVACVPAQEGRSEKVVGWGQFSRKGSDIGARNFVKSKGWTVRIELWLLSWWFWTYSLVTNAIWPDRITDRQATKSFDEWGRVDDEKYWTSHPERHDRWHAQAVIVSPEFQGKGIGRLLMGHVIEKAEQEMVPIGLTASPHGEKLYEKLGFQKLGDFSQRVADHEGGGIMIWYPDGFQGKRHDAREATEMA
ncbi:hypothetical protein D0Z07_4627 [Hyphodiscus hymeniophilus]|uniref:N-acetyltransferase domain-containing protein n=1 Tax=Hyphodiscus hymeniophilus TaxID=353542 RepID=A0A9P6VJ09_9HELO|nr:hypothetical protein D0Z07_4627 [Hyphodiscus hymeniophilus]